MATLATGKNYSWTASHRGQQLAGKSRLLMYYMRTLSYCLSQNLYTRVHKTMPELCDMCRYAHSVQHEATHNGSVHTLGHSSLDVPAALARTPHTWLRWLGHTARMSQDRLPYQCMFGQLSGTQAKGKPRDTWQSTVYRDLSTLHIQYSWFRLAHDRKWSETVDCSCTYLAGPAEPA